MAADTTIDEVGDGVFRFSTFVEEAALVFNQYLLVAEEPMLFHTGKNCPNALAVAIVPYLDASTGALKTGIAESCATAVLTFDIM